MGGGGGGGGGEGEEESNLVHSSIENTVILNSIVK